MWVLRPPRQNDAQQAASWHVGTWPFSDLELFRPNFPDAEGACSGCTVQTKREGGLLFPAFPVQSRGCRGHPVAQVCAQVEGPP